MSQDTDSLMADDYSSDESDDITRVLCDRQDHKLPLTANLSKEDLVLLLTPVVPPSEESQNDEMDPFEPLGRALAEVVSVRHVPYNRKGGITGLHVTFIRRVKAVVLVLTALDGEAKGPQIEVGALVRQVCEAQRLLFIVGCCEIASEDLHDDLISEFATVIVSRSYTQRCLTAVAESLMGPVSEGDINMASPPAPDQEVQTMPKSWTVELWKSNKDAADTHELWLDAMPKHLHLDRTRFDGVLHRPGGFSDHSIVRCPDGRLVGFCAAYISFVSGTQQKKVGFIAAIVVHEDFRGQGIGTSLHNETVARLRRETGHNRIELGSAFPRLLPGLPSDCSQSKWFAHRGWVSEDARGKGRTVADWAARFADMPILSLASAGLTFRRCQMTDWPQVYETISRHGSRMPLGNCDHYTATLDSAGMEDIILGFEGENLAASAITYIPTDNSPSAKDIPWPSALGAEIGGVTCMFFIDDDPEIINRKDTIMMRLLDSCIKALQERGMVGVYMDAVSSDGDNTLEKLGFKKYAEYHKAWQNF